MNTPSEIKTEMANALSHGLGILLTVVASPVLIARVVQTNNPTLTFAVAFYCFTILLMFTFSTLYHAFSNPLVKKTLRIFDHISIFFLIGGTYIPFVVLFTPAQTAFWFLIIQWTLIGFGVVKKIFFTGQYRLLSTLIYIFIGCLVFFLGASFWNLMPDKSIYLLAVGGILYLIGTVFYQNQKIPYNHFIWHLFVLFAAFCHYLAVLLAV
ncbi:hemolysin III family protein [Emticicia sp. W12TSBA100-4]|uniref:PAQR family membrane homeostasis protein TrhA n=1 Tax=Emticicia sp. W12TSBA100-4 TaxID=3160965 RepID=UPI0033065769